jgi:hypothetical protein
MNKLSVIVKRRHNKTYVLMNSFLLSRINRCVIIKIFRSDSLPTPITFKKRIIICVIDKIPLTNKITAIISIITYLKSAISKNCKLYVLLELNLRKHLLRFNHLEAIYKKYLKMQEKQSN